jgi:4'-phosphopantetheinyl transferase EntD
MSLYQSKKISKNTQIGIWKITETEKELSSLYLEAGFDSKSILQTKNNLRKKQWLATRILARHFTNASVIYNDMGKPKLNNGWNISISHSNEFVAILINPHKNCGIDIEKISKKVSRIKNKFLSPEDLLEVTSDEDLTIYWGAKEALYKYYGEKEVLFAEHLFLSDFSKQTNQFTGEINMPEFQKEINMHYEKIEDFILVYTL